MRTEYRRMAIIDRVLLPGLLDHYPGVSSASSCRVLTDLGTSSRAP